MKYRVYDVAKKFEISSEAMVKLLAELGCPVKSHMSSIDEETVSKIRKKFSQEKAEIKRRVEIKKEKIQKLAAKERKGLGEKKKIRKRRRKKPVEIEKKERKTSQPVALTPERAGKEAAKRRRRKRRIDETAVKETIKKTLAKIDAGVKKRKRKKLVSVEGDFEEESKNVAKVSEFVSVAELADLIKVPASDIISVCINLGYMVTINQRLDFDTISIICDEFGYKAVQAEEYNIEFVEEEEEEIVENLEPRAPIVTVMGHVDHGKTSLLDYIRKTNVIAGEAGSITQHIGAYEVELGGGKRVTFLDTPGHEAFTAMRARGAQVTDIVVLVVAADDRVMPQTIEAIDHAKAANVSIVVAINKIDLPTADVNKVKQELMQHGVVVEDFGGKLLCSAISAKLGEGIEHLLEQILLESEVLELKANPQARAKGVVIEAKLDRGMGPVATVLITDGTLTVGTPFICGLYSGKVRAMLDERGMVKQVAEPSVPVQILGFSGVPQAGDTFRVMKDEQSARDISQVRQRLKREQDFRRQHRLTLDELYDRIKAGAVQNLNLIIKADVDGSAGALADSLEKLSNDEVKVNVIRRGVGAISETDVMLAAASNAIIIGFSVRPDARGRETSQREGVEIRLYQVIYEAVEEVRLAMEGLLEPEKVETLLGSAKVLEIFKVSKVGTIAGCQVESGAIQRNAIARVYRDDQLVIVSKIGSLKRFKDDVREVATGFECGIGIEGFNDLKVGDVIDVFKIEEVKRKLVRKQQQPK